MKSEHTIVVHAVSVKILSIIFTYYVQMMMSCGHTVAVSEGRVLAPSLPHTGCAGDTEVPVGC